MILPFTCAKPATIILLFFLICWSIRDLLFFFNQLIFKCFELNFAAPLFIKNDPFFFALPLLFFIDFSYQQFTYIYCLCLDF